jgi:hypothetical protein
MNKYYLFGAIAVLGIIGTSFGAWAKITHQAYSDTAMGVGIISQAVGLIALVVLLVLRLQKKN